ncbi:MAG: DUF4062 domain-containing protein [Candidatus Omnitrophica bacterium]|nr:DUF4062 domain-containing protein [Candidatus Omnitrophota bacterium]
MPAPRVFISSTYYNLRHVREIIRDFIISLGYEPVLSEYSEVLYRPGDSVQNSCLEEIKHCDMFVLIIGQRYGSLFPKDTLSITHREYLEASSNNIPIFAFVDRDVYADFKIWQKNQHIDSIKYIAVHENEIFKFIDDIMSKAVDNALIPYGSISDLLNHLRKQWAAMFKLYAFVQEREKAETDRKDVEISANSLDAQKRLPIFLHQLEIIGVQSPNVSDILNHPTFVSLIDEKSQSIHELETDLHIQFTNRTSNLGKNILATLEEDYSSLRKLNKEELEVLFGSIRR